MSFLQENKLAFSQKKIEKIETFVSARWPLLIATPIKNNTFLFSFHCVDIENVYKNILPSLTA